MRICITLDDVIRAKTLQFGKTYKKYIDDKFDLNSVEFTTNNYYELFPFDSKKDYNKFLYDDYSFNIFAECPLTEKLIDKRLNLWLLSLEDNDDIDEPIEVVLSNPLEYNESIGYTYFFLSKIATRVRETYFPKDSSKIWDKCDILITADPKLLSNKPDGKKTIKITMDYNKDIESDFSYNSLSELLIDNNFFKNIANND